MTDRVQLTPTMVEEARTRISGQAVVTPLLNSAILDETVGGRVFLKCENLQRTGSFKFRGAYNAIASLSGEARAKGLIAVSSGNHAQGVAEAARLFGVPATIIMPADAPAIKTERVKRSGAQIIPYDRYTQDREAMALALAQETGSPLVHPFEDMAVMAGQGTTGLESIDQLQGVEPDIGLICCGGGGLAAGVSTVWRAAFPQMEMYTVEPEGFDDTARSLVQGERLANDPANRSICDAIVTPIPGTNTFPILQTNGLKGLAVRDDEVLAAMGFALRELKMVVEPGGVVTLAALLARRIRLDGRTALAVLSGGNADPGILGQAIDR